MRPASPRADLPFVAPRKLCYTPARMELSVVIPVRNEAPNIAPLVAEIRAALDGALDYEIVYVDDGSSDDTAAAIGNLARAFPRLATLDGDGQNDPADIPRLWEIALAAPPAPPLLVAGHRQRRQDSAVKRVSSRIANRVRGRLLRDGTPDTGCGLKLFRRDVFLDLPFFDHIHRFLPALVQREGGRVVSVVVNHRPRERGRSNYGTFDRLWVGITDLFGVMWLQRRAKNPEILAESAEEARRAG